MDSWQSAERFVAGLVVVLTLVAGPAVGFADVTERNPTTVGDGDAAVTVESLPTEQIRIDAGRFGTDVDYLRVPSATVRVGNVSGVPRLLYRVQVPALDVDVVAERLVTDADAGRVLLVPRDRGLDPDHVTESRYDATVTVRVQSFEVDRFVVDRNVTVEVAR